MGQSWCHSRDGNWWSAYFEVVENYGRAEGGSSKTDAMGNGVSGASSSNKTAGGNNDEDDEMLAQDRALEQQALMYENYVRGMLSNFGQLPLDRIHNMLSMFVPGDDNAISAQSSAAVVTPVQPGKLVFDGSVAKFA